MAEIYAHRGGAMVAPENTLPAFQAALDMGVDGIELDVHCCQDGALVVIHDISVERTTDGAGKVSELTLAELRGLDAGSHFGPQFAGARVPTLDEVLDLVEDRCRVNVELKTLDYRGGDEAGAVADILAARRLYDQVIVSSFNPVALMKMRRLAAKAPLGLLYHDVLPSYMLQAWFGPLINPEALHPHFSLVDAAALANARELGKAVNVWTVNDVDEARRLDALGVDAIITDAPDVIMAGLAAAI